MCGRCAPPVCASIPSLTYVLGLAHVSRIFPPQSSGVFLSRFSSRNFPIPQQDGPPRLPSPLIKFWPPTPPFPPCPLPSCAWQSITGFSLIRFFGVRRPRLLSKVRGRASPSVQPTTPRPTSLFPCVPLLSF